MFFGRMPLLCSKCFRKLPLLCVNCSVKLPLPYVFFSKKKPLLYTKFAAVLLQQQSNVGVPWQITPEILKPRCWPGNKAPGEAIDTTRGKAGRQNHRGAAIWQTVQAIHRAHPEEESRLAGQVERYAEWLMQQVPG
jgi:hypothetical protein